MKCQKCGFEVSQGELFCGNCGSQINYSVPNKKRYCGNCGSEMGSDEKFCGVCGHGESLTTPDGERPKRKWFSFTAIIISVILIAIITASGTIAYLIAKSQNDDDTEDIEIVNNFEDDNNTEADIYNNEDENFSDEINELPLNTGMNNFENEDSAKDINEDESIFDNGINEEVLLDNDSSIDEYLFPEDSEYITVEYLSTLTKGEIGLIRNEIYARHGYIFKTEEFSNYFKSKSWYQPNPNFDASTLSEIERTNVNTILAYEKQMGWR